MTEKVKAFQLWGEPNWDELIKFFKANNINDGWLPYSGFSKINETRNAIDYTKRIDRFQKQSSLGGGFGSPILEDLTNIDGKNYINELYFTYDSRMLKDALDENTYYFEFKMTSEAKDVTLQIGDVAPWSNKLGNLAGEQIKFSKGLHEMPNTYFTSVKAQVKINGKFRKCIVEGKGVVTELQTIANKLPLDISDDLVDYINSSKDILFEFKNAQATGKLDELIESYKIFRKNGIKTPCK